MELSDEDVAKLLAKDIDQHKSKAPNFSVEIEQNHQEKYQTLCGKSLIFWFLKKCFLFFGNHEFFFCFLKSIGVG